MYKDETQKAEKKLCELLCISAHAEIQGLLLDFPAQNPKEIEDRLRIVLMLAYLNIQVFAETFLDRYNSDLSEITKSTLKIIVTSVGKQIPNLEPDIENFATMLLLKKGNFMTVL
jgi:transposase